jgi:hypothetical protein
MSILGNRVLRKEDGVAAARTNGALPVALVDMSSTPSVAFRQHLAGVLVGRALEGAGT